MTIVPEDKIDNEIIGILSVLPEQKKQKLLDYIQNILDERYQYWESYMGEDL